MKKLTKLLSIFVIAGSVSCFSGALTGCGVHTHEYSDQWSTSATEHWHAAICEHNDEKTDVGSHVDADENGKCDVCGYELSVVAVEYDVSFDLNGHGGSENPAAVKTVNKKITPPASPTDENWDFLGWTLPDSDAVLDLSTYEFTSSVTLKAKWAEKEAEEFTVSFDLNGHGAAIESATTVDGKITAPDSPQNDDYIFGGWYETADCTGDPIDFATKVFSENTTVYAKWTERNIAAELDLEANYSVGDSLFLFTDRVKSCAIYKEGSDVALADENGEVILSEEGVYEYVVTQNNDKKTTIKFQVVSGQNLVYSYATEEEGKDSVNKHISYNDGGTEWLREYQGEYGVRATKAGKAQNMFQFDIGNVPFEFDSIVVRIYFKTEAAEKIKIYSQNIRICEGNTAVAANAWVDLVIPRSAIQTAGGLFDLEGQGRYDTVKNFYEDVFGTVGYNNQQAFKFHIYQDGTGNLIAPDVYISTIRYTDRNVANEIECNASYAVGTQFTLFNDGVKGSAIYKVGSQTALEATDGKVTLAEAGEYKYVITPNTGDDIVIFFSVEDKTNFVYSYDTDKERTFNFHNGGTEWMRYYEGEYGVRKATTPDQLRFDLGSTAFDFDYVTVRIYLKADANTVSFGSYWSPLGEVSANQWVDFVIERTGIQTGGSHLYKFYAPSADPASYEEFKSIMFGALGYGNQQAFMLDFTGAKPTEVYISSISYGVRERDIAAEVNCAATYALGSQITLFNADVQGSAIYKVGSQTALEATDGKVTLAEAGVYKYVITPNTGDDIVIFFSVEDATNMVYGWSTEKEGANSFDFHIGYNDGGTEWLREYQGEYGVRKAKKGYNQFQFDVGSTAFEFDYVLVRVYFSIENVNAIRLYSHYSMICEGSSAVAANKWVDLLIPRSAIQTGGSNFGVSGGRTDIDANFYEDLFGRIGCAEPNAFKFTIYNAADNQLIAPVVYVSSVRYGNYSPIEGTSVYDFGAPYVAGRTGGWNQPAWNDRGGGTGSTFLAYYQGETGVYKANASQSYFTFDVNGTKFAFDYINVRIYIESDKQTVNIYHRGGALVAENVVTNQWVTLKIARSTISNLDKLFEADSWGYQTVLVFDVKDGEGNGVNVTTYASYISYTQPASVTVTFDMNGHGGESVTKSAYQGYALSELPAAPTDENYSFTGWYTNKECTGDPVDLATYVFAEDTVLYARWIAPIPVIENGIYTFDINQDWSAAEGGLNSRAWDDNYGESTWMEFFNGEHGVQKANNVQSYFTFDIGRTPFTFDYINIRVYFASESATVNVYCGSNLVAANVATNQWVTLKITSDMVNNANGHFMQVCGWYPLLAPSNMFDTNSWGNQVMFYFDLKDGEGNGINVTTYLSYVSYDPLTPSTVSFDMNGHGTAIESVQTSQGDRIAADAIPAAPTDENYSFTGWYTNKECTGDPVDLATYVFAEDTVLYARWIAPIPVIENGIYTFDTNQNWSDAEGGLNSRAWDDNYGESTWMEFFNGEHGVQKANNVQSYFTFDIGSDAFTFDYIEVRIYLASEKSSVNIYCGDVLVAENVATNQWVTLRIDRSKIQNANSYFYKSRPDLVNDTYLSDEKFLSGEIAFSASSWGYQDIFHFDVKDSSGAAVNVTTYVSYIRYGVNATQQA